MIDFVLMGTGIGVGGYIVMKVFTGSVPGVGGMLGPGAAGAVLGAMFYIFRSGVGEF